MISKSVEITTGTLKELRALPVPSGDADLVASMYAKVDDAMNLATQADAALRAGDRQRGQELLTQLDTATKQANAAARDYGEIECAK